MDPVVRPSVCPLDCPDTCSLHVTVEDGRVTRVRGSDANPYTAGRICAKVAASFPDWVHGEGRLRTPLLRVGPRGPGARFERIGWDEALDRVHAGLSAAIARHGPESVLPLNYAGPHGMLAGGSMDLRFFHRLGATRLDRKPLCGGVRLEAWRGTFGAMPGLPPEDVALARDVVVWGNDVTVANLHLTPLIDRARRAGASLTVVDPRRIKLAERAGHHVALRPGTDVVLAWAVAAELERRGAVDRDFVSRHVHGAEDFLALARAWTPERAAETCGLAPDDVRRLADVYARGGPLAVSVGNGLERNRNGGAGIRAIYALSALAGRFGRPGDGVVGGASNAFPKSPVRLTRPDLCPPATRTFNIVDVGAHLLDPALAPPVAAVFVYNHNPVLVHPDQERLVRGLLRDDLFVVGCDVVMTDSMAYADVVLPAASHFEYPDLYPAYGTHWLQRAEPVIPPVGESLPNTEIFRRLAARFGFGEAALRATDEELMDAALDADDPRLGGTRPSRLPLDRATPMRLSGEPLRPFVNVTPQTPSGRIELASDVLAQAWNARLPAFRPAPADALPLVLLSPASDRRITSTFGGQPDSDGLPRLDMHPDDAAARGLVDGAPVRVWNAQGEVHLRLSVTRAVRPGVVSSDKGAWMRASPTGRTVSVLAPAHHADLARGACFNDARVDVAALG